TDVQKLIQAVHNDTIVIATARPPWAKTATLERRVLIGGPPEVVRLCESGDVRILEKLLPLLADPARAWAANAVLAKLTEMDEKTVDIYMRDPRGWWDAYGANARQRWRRYLDEWRGGLVWDRDRGAFVTR